MVSFFGLFSKKRAASGPSSSSGQRSLSTHEVKGSAATPITQNDTSDHPSSAAGATGLSRSRSSGRFLSLRRRSSKPYDQTKRPPTRGSIDLTRRRSQQLSRSTSEGLAALYTPLPKLDLSLDFEKDASGPLVGLEGVGRPVALRIEERKVLDQLKLTVEEVQKGWKWFGQALNDLGAEFVGIMLPRRISTDAQTQLYLLAMYALTLRPQLHSSLPSITSQYPQTVSSSSNAATVWQDRLLAAIRETHNPLDLAEILKWILRRLSPSTQRAVLGREQYINFVQAEHASSYPLDAYNAFLNQKLESDLSVYLNETFEMLAGIATHAEENTMSAGRLSYLLGYWILGTSGSSPKDFKGFYEVWKDNGVRTEHLLYAWIRYQSTKQQIPTRLLELVHHYPFGESSASSEHLPLPPPSSFSRQTLHVTLSSNTPIEELSYSVEQLVRAAFASSSLEHGAVPLWSSFRHSDASHPVGIEDVLSEESLKFLHEATTTSVNTPPGTPQPSDFATPADTDNGPMYRPFSTISAGRTSPHSHAGQLSQSHTVPSPKESSQSSSTPIADGKPLKDGDSLKSIRKQASTSVLPIGGATGDRSIWDSFQQSGFADSPSAVNNLGLAFSPKSNPLASLNSISPITPTSPFNSNFRGSNATLRPAMKKKTTFRDDANLALTPVFTISREEVIEVDDVFIAFVEDGQLDIIVSATWPPFALVRLAKTLENLPLPDPKPIDWLLITSEYHPPTPSNVSEPEFLARAASPSAASTTSRLSTTRGLKDFANSFKRSASFPIRPSTGTGSGMRRSFFGASGRSLAKQAGFGDGLEPLSEADLLRELKAPPSAQSLAPTEYTIGEMGEMIKIPSVMQDQKPEGHMTTPASHITDSNAISQTPSIDWKYVAEGGAHLVFAYRGSQSPYIGKVLRIRKAMAPIDPTATADDRTGIQNAWRFELLPKLLPSDVLVQAEEVTLEETWLKDIFSVADEERPETRKKEALSQSVNGPGTALLMEDVTVARVGDVRDELALAIEIKPKWGFLPDAQYIQPPESVDIKTHHCRFCTHQHLRGKRLNEQIQYCPLDLYSGDEARMCRALEGLWDIWRESDGKANNWRVFVNGIGTTPGQKNAVPTSSQDSLAAGTADFILPVLQKADVLRHLATLQSTLDATDISDLAARFTSAHPTSELFDPSIIPEPSLLELKEFVDLYLSRPEAGKVKDGWNLRQRLIAYSLSAIFKDCSIFVNCTLIRSFSGAETAWKLDIERSSVKIIDLDLKPIRNMRKWYDLDQEIWRHWLDSKTSDPVPSVAAEPQTPKKRKAVPPLLEISLDSSSTRALFLPTPDRSAHGSPASTPATSTAVTETDRQSMAEVSALSPTKTAPLQSQARESEEVLEDEKVVMENEVEAGRRATTDHSIGDDPITDRRERSLAPSPSPRLGCFNGPCVDDDSKLDTIVIPSGEGESEQDSNRFPEAEFERDEMEDKAQSVTDHTLGAEQTTESAHDTGILSALGAAAVGAVASVASAMGIVEETSSEIREGQEPVPEADGSSATAEKEQIDTIVSGPESPNQLAGHTNEQMTTQPTEPAPLDHELRDPAQDLEVKSKTSSVTNPPLADDYTSIQASAGGDDHVSEHSSAAQESAMVAMLDTSLDAVFENKSEQDGQPIAPAPAPAPANDDVVEPIMAATSTFDILHNAQHAQDNAPSAKPTEPTTDYLQENRGSSYREEEGQIEGHTLVPIAEDPPGEDVEAALASQPGDTVVARGDLEEARSVPPEEREIDAVDATISDNQRVEEPELAKDAFTPEEVSDQAENGAVKLGESEAMLIPSAEPLSRDPQDESQTSDVNVPLQPSFTEPKDNVTPQVVSPSDLPAQGSEDDTKTVSSAEENAFADADAGLTDLRAEGVTSQSRLSETETWETKESSVLAFQPTGDSAHPPPAVESDKVTQDEKTLEDVDEELQGTSAQSQRPSENSVAIAQQEDASGNVNTSSSPHLLAPDARAMMENTDATHSAANNALTERSESVTQELHNFSAIRGQPIVLGPPVIIPASDASTGSPIASLASPSSEPAHSIRNDEQEEPLSAAEKIVAPESFEPSLLTTSSHKGIDERPKSGDEGQGSKKALSPPTNGSRDVSDERKDTSNEQAERASLNEVPFYDPSAS